MLSIAGCSKTYGNGVKALDHVSLEIEPGMFGLLGPNGAGKSTLMRTIAGLQAPDSGRILFDGVDVLRHPTAIREKLGYLPQEFGVYPKISALDLLDHISVLKGMVDRKARKEQVARLLTQTNLWDDRKKAVSSFSGGMRRRFGIAQALLGSPQIIIVDEPTAGLDPGERNRFYNLLSEIGRNVVVLLSTHLVDDVHNLCTQTAILHEGCVRKVGAPAKLVSELAGQVWQRTVAHRSEIEPHWSVLSQKLSAGRPVVRVLAETQPGQGFQPAPANLEDVYFATLQTAEVAHVA